MRVRPASEFRDPGVLHALKSADAPEIRVLKFGGSSLAGTAKFEHAVSRIAALRAAGTMPIVVVSAVGGVTDRLLELATRTGTHRSPRELDALLATGEAASAALFAGSLHRRGVGARSLDARTLGLLSDGRHGAATLEEFDPEPLCRCLDAGLIPVVAGYQAIDREGETTTLGRGGSDTTAVACAVAIGETIGTPVSCEILTDVSGIHSIDPNLVVATRPARSTNAAGSKAPNLRRVARHARSQECSPRADRASSASTDAWPPRPIQHLGHRDLLALAEGGSRIVAASAARLAARHRVSLVVASSEGGLTPDLRTRIGAESTIPADRFAIATATERVVFTLRSRDRTFTPAASRNHRDAPDAFGDLEQGRSRLAGLSELLGPSPFQIAEQGHTIVVPAAAAESIRALLEDGAVRQADTWIRQEPAGIVTLVAGRNVQRVALPEPTGRLGPRTWFWRIPSGAITATAIRMHELLASSNARSESPSAEIEILTIGSTDRAVDRGPLDQAARV